jgi:hypothetical protein
MGVTTTLLGHLQASSHHGTCWRICSPANLGRRDFPPAGKDPAIGWSRVSQNLGDNKKIQLGWVPKYVLSLSKEWAKK